MINDLLTRFLIMAWCGNNQCTPISEKHHFFLLLMCWALTEYLALLIVYKDAGLAPQGKKLLSKKLENGNYNGSPSLNFGCSMSHEFFFYLLLCCYCEISQPNFLPTTTSPPPRKIELIDLMKLKRMLAGWGYTWAQRSPAFTQIPHSQLLASSTILRMLGLKDTQLNGGSDDVGNTLLKMVPHKSLPKFASFPSLHSPPPPA